MFLSNALKLKAEAALRGATNKNALVEIVGTAMSMCPRKMETELPKHAWYGSIDYEHEGIWLLLFPKFRTRDKQKVAGYLEMLELILGAYADMRLSESLILTTNQNSAARTQSKRWDFHPARWRRSSRSSKALIGWPASAKDQAHVTG
ncbi:MAG: hypothetical protein HYX63_23540 [Gammaproteobacteria bacterium]|nr:hypothetical protein [Gammaproteobacteria bacterium]